MTYTENIDKMNKWKLSRVNQGYQMTRVEGGGIACRELTRWEKIKLYWLAKKICPMRDVKR